MVSAQRHLITEPKRPPFSMMRPYSRHRRCTRAVMSPSGIGVPMVSFGPLGSMNSTPSISPLPRTSPMIDTSSLSLMNPALRRSPLRVTSSRNPGCLILFMTMDPAAMASWLPRNVPAWAPAPQASSFLS